VNRKGKFAAAAAALTALIATTGAAVLTNYATTTVPPWLRDPCHVWPLLAVLVGAGFVATGIASRLASNNSKDEPSGELRIASIRPDTEECFWEKSDWDDSRFYLHPRRPPYMQFIEVNDIVKHYASLSDDMQRIFTDVLKVLKASLSRGKLIDVSRQKSRTFKALKPEEFYKAMILLNRMSHYFKEADQGDIYYDVRDGAQAGNLEIAKSAVDFYLYNLDQVRAVMTLLPTLWDYASAGKDALDESMRQFKVIFMRTEDLIIDVTLINDTPATQLIEKFVVRVLDSQIEILAGPRAEPVAVSCKYNFDVDLSLDQTEMTLDPPIAFGSDRAARMKIKMHFLNARGNVVSLSFGFAGGKHGVVSSPYRVTI
jgi:hypothetical protein